MKKIGMIAAMTSELNSMLERFDGTELFATLGGRTVLKAETNGKELYIIESGVGEIFAASATQYLISVCGVEAIINFGVCGSLKKSHGLKKTVLVGGIVHYEMDTSAIDDIEAGRYAFLPTPVIPMNEGLIAKAKAINPTLEAVLCASGNKFIDKKEDKEYLVQTFNADVCEMESAGIALTCLINNTPCLMVKAVSDGEGGAEDFNATVLEATRVYTELVMNLIKTL